MNTKNTRILPIACCAFCYYFGRREWTGAMGVCVEMKKKVYDASKIQKWCPLEKYDVKKGEK